MAWNDSCGSKWCAVLFHFLCTGSINNQRAPVLIYQNTSLLSLLPSRRACRTHFMAIIAWNAKLGEKWANWGDLGQLEWEVVGQVGHLMLKRQVGQQDLSSWRVFYLSLTLSFYLFIFSSFHLFIFLSFYLFIFLSFYLFIF